MNSLLLLRRSLSQVQRGSTTSTNHCYYRWSSTKAAAAAGTTSTSNNLTKTELIKEVAEHHELTLAKSERIVNTIFDTIAESMVSSRPVKISKFGTFDCYKSRGRNARNPRTGAAMFVPEKMRVRFKPYDALKKRVEETK